VLPLLYVSRFDLAHDAADSFAHWYSQRHAWDLVGAGFLSVSSFRALRGAPWVCNLYELHDIGAFGPAYQQAQASDGAGAGVRLAVSNQSLAVYEQIVTLGVVDDGTDLARWGSALLAPVVTTLRFSTSASDEEVAAWYREGEEARHATARGCLSVRVGRQIDAGRPNVDPRRWSVIAEWANRGAAIKWADSEPDVLRTHTAALGELTDASLDVLLRQSVLHHPDAWHDAPSGGPTAGRGSPR
jgi:hypothetical protein